MSAVPPAAAPAGWPQGLLLASMICLAIIPGLALFPVLPAMEAHFSAAPAHQVLMPLIVMLPTLMVALFALPSGWLGDRMGLKPLLICALALYGAFGLAPMLLNSLPSIIAVRVILGVALAAIITTSTAMIGNLFSGAVRARWLAAQAATAGLSAIAVAAVGGLLGDMGWRAAFLQHGLAFVLVPVSVILLWRRSGSAVSATSESVESDSDAFSWVRFGWFCALNAFAGGNAVVLIVESGFILAERHAGAPSTIGLANALGGVAVVAGATLGGALASRPLTLKLALSFGLMTAGYLIAAGSGDYRVAIAALAIHSLGGGLVLPSLAQWGLAYLPASIRGRGIGVLQASVFVGQFLSPFYVLGLSQLLKGLNQALVAAALLVALAAGVALVELLRNHRRPANPVPDLAAP